MNYTKFLKNRKQTNYKLDKSARSKSIMNQFKINLTDDKIKISVEILKDIKKTKLLIQNYIRLDFKVDIDEYMAYFLKDKNEFIDEFKEFLNNKKGSRLTLMAKRHYLAILEILKKEIDNLLKEYKNLKQKMLKKMSKKENFWKIKEDFLKKQSVVKHEISSTNKIENTKTGETENSNPNKTSISSLLQFNITNLPIPFKNDKKVRYDKNKNQNNYNDTHLIELNDENKLKEEDIYKDSANTMKLFHANEVSNLDKTKQILFELSDLMTNFSTKVLEHQEITKNIISNSTQSLDNIQKANKELIKCQENQKGRGFMIGTIFIVLGLFLIYYDYTL